MSFRLAELLHRTPEVLNAVDRCVTDKTVYYSKAEAQAALKLVNSRPQFGSGTPMKSFRCDFCDRWHLGHRR